MEVYNTDRQSRNFVWDKYDEAWKDYNKRERENIKG